MGRWGLDSVSGCGNLKVVVGEVGMERVKRGLWGG